MKERQTTNSRQPGRFTRRCFVRAGALAAGAWGLGAPQVFLAAGAGEKLNLAVIGVGGKGASDTDHCAGENIVALCDVDENLAAGQLKKYPNARFFRDFRKLFDELGKSLDAVIVSTPDHLHAPAAVMAMRLGKHVYCQKPLAHSVFEARMMRDLAKAKGLITQMGNQGSAEEGFRRAVEIIQAGVIGAVRQAHVWSNRPIWPQGMDRPAGEDPVPANLDWDLWLGPALLRPYKKDVYHPFKWRGWQDFGTGALGDMACHLLNLPFRGLKLDAPTEIEAESSDRNAETYPRSAKIRFEFPARENLPAATLWWYDGGWKPSPDLTGDLNTLMGEAPGSGCLLLGDKGRIFSPDDYGAQFYLKLSDENEFKAGAGHPAVQDIPRTIARNPHPGDGDRRHHLEWIAGMKGGSTPYSSFAAAGPLTEIALLGNVASRLSRKLEWDGLNGKAKNTPEAAPYLRRECRKGWELT